MTPTSPSRHPLILARFRWRLLAAVALAVGLSALLPGTVAGREPESSRASKQDLTRERLPELLALIRPHEDEWRHLRVRWLTDVVAARKQAAAQDRPIVICYTGGAGYNEPLGVC